MDSSGTTPATEMRLALRRMEAAYEGDIAARDREIEALQRSLAACKLHDLEAAWQR